MSYQVFFSDPGITSKAGFGRVAHLPCIFDSRPSYHRFGSEYLLERGLGVWVPFGELRPIDRIAPTAQSIKNYAYWLANFLEWCDTRNIELRNCSFTTDIQERYQREMVTGAWSRQGIPLSDSTVALRVHQARDFLCWMAHKGYRPAFILPTNQISIKTRNTIKDQAGDSASKEANFKPPHKRRKLKIPSDRKVTEWLDSIYQNCGHTEGLICELILVSAMRREEVAAFRVDSIPENIADWEIANPTAPYAEQQVSISIRFGTKGKCYGYDHEDKIGPERDIKVPLAIVDRLHIYRNKVRTIALRKWVKSAGALEEKKTRIANSVHLFLKENTGNRITGRDIYSIWTSVPLPIEGWSPHQGRHWWACCILWNEFKKHRKLPNSNSSDVPLNFTPFGLDIIRLVISPQLGHSNESTTLIYLKWFSDMVGTGLSISYDLD